MGGGVCEFAFGCAQFFEIGSCKLQLYIWVFYGTLKKTHEYFSVL